MKFSKIVFILPIFACLNLEGMEAPGHAINLTVSNLERGLNDLRLDAHGFRAEYDRQLADAAHRGGNLPPVFDISDDKRYLIVHPDQLYQSTSMGLEESLPLFVALNAAIEAQTRAQRERQRNQKDKFLILSELLKFKVRQFRDAQPGPLPRKAVPFINRLLHEEFQPHQYGHFHDFVLGLGNLANHPNEERDIYIPRILRTILANQGIMPADSGERIKTHLARIQTPLAQTTIPWIVTHFNPRNLNAPSTNHETRGETLLSRSLTRGEWYNTMLYLRGGLNPETPDANGRRPIDIYSRLPREHQ